MESTTSGAPDFTSRLWTSYSVHEPLYFLRERGGGPVDTEARYMYRHSEEYIKKMADAGYNLCFVHFFKGYGFELEKQEMERSQRMIRCLNRYGIRAAAYVTVGSLTYHAIMAETDGQAGDWFQRNFLGEPNSCQVTYQAFRRRPCFNVPAYREYMKRVVRKAAEIGADMIHCDNVGHAHEPNVCRCGYCRDAFREFLKSRYDPDDPEKKKLCIERFGYAALDYMEPPLFDKHQTPDRYRKVTVPVHQEWIDFKVHVLTDFFRMIRAVCDETGLLLHMNSGEFPGFNSRFWRGNSPSRLNPLADSVFSEEGLACGINDKGTKLVRWRTFKMAENRADIAEVSGNSLKCHGENTLYSVRGCTGVHPDAAGPDADAARRLFAFTQKHEDHLVRKRSAGRIAVLRSEPALCYNTARAYQSVCTMEQLCIQYMLPFVIIDDAQLENGIDADLLILPDVQLMSRNLWEQVKTFVSGGGRVLTTEDTGMYDIWYRPYTEPLVEQILEPGTAGAGIRHGSFGNGAVTHIPVIEYPRTYPESSDSWTVTPEFWEVPRNSRDILREIEALMHDKLRFRTEYHPTVVMDLFEEKSDKPGWQAVHIQDLAGGSPADLSFDWRPPEGRALQAAHLWQPAGDTDLEPLNSDGWFSFAFSMKDAIAVVRMEL